jgi:hypothetical protein
MPDLVARRKAALFTTRAPPDCPDDVFYLSMISEIGGWGEGSLGNWPLNPGRSAAGKGLAFSRS